MQEKNINTAEYVKIIKESPEKKKSYIFFGFTLVVTIVLIAFAIRPTVVTITKINQEIKEKTAVNGLLDSKIETLSALDNEYSENQDKFEGLELIFPAGGNFSLFMSNIDSVAARNGFTISSISFDKYKGDSFDIGTKIIQPKSVNFSFRGRAANLVNFLKDLESLPMYPVIESVSYSTQSDRDGLNSFSVSLRIYDVENINFYE